MLAECSLVMLGVNALLFVTSLLEKMAAHVLMGAGLLIAAAGLGQTLGSAAGGWLFGVLGHRSYGLLALPLLVMLGLLLTRPSGWSGEASHPLQS